MKGAVFEFYFRDPERARLRSRVAELELALASTVRAIAGAREAFVGDGPSARGARMALDHVESLGQLEAVLGAGAVVTLEAERLGLRLVPGGAA